MEGIEQCGGASASAWCVSKLYRVAVVAEVEDVAEKGSVHCIPFGGHGDFFPAARYPSGFRPNIKSSREGSPIGLGLFGGYPTNKPRPRESLPYQITHNLKRNAH
jgi:hypothetical protein